MTIRFPQNNDPLQTIAQARAIADDLARIAAGASPTADDLAAAPFLDLWRPALRPTVALIGIVHGHPRIAAGHTALTTDVVALDVDAGWARSWSRFYALGRRIGDAGRRQ